MAQSYEPTSIESAREAVADFSYPVVLKWPDPHRVSGRLSELGIAMEKFEYAADLSELLARLERYAGVGEFPMVQEYCPGVGVGHMFLSVDGEVTLEFQHERLHEWPPEGGSSSLCRSVPLTEHGDARARSRALIKALRWSGVSMVEYRYDRSTGRYAFMEINGRFWGSMPLAVHAGMRPQAIQDPHFRAGRLRTVLGFVAQISNPRMTYYVLSASDPGPFVADVRNVLAKGVRGAWALFRQALWRR